MKNWWMVILGVVFGLLAAGVILLTSAPTNGNPITLLPPPTPIPLKVHITGEVNNPGVYELPLDSRVIDLINAAGGFTSTADQSAVNLAAPIEDGELIRVHAQYQTETPLPEILLSSTNIDSNPKETNQPAEYQPRRININTADLATLETLSGIGPTIAQNIIDFRDENGPFTAIEQIQKVSGIGPVKYENIKDYITVESLP